MEKRFVSGGKEIASEDAINERRLTRARNETPHQLELP
jgi:hypothetical protein